MFQKYFVNIQIGVGEPHDNYLQVTGIGIVEQVHPSLYANALCEIDEQGIMHFQDVTARTNLI